jgi:hypothetical protein
VTTPVVPLLVAALVFACDPGADAPSRRDAGVDSGAAPTDAGPPPDTGPRIDAGSWFDAIYGPNDGRMAGDPCDVAFDECRTTRELMVCLDDARDPTTGTGTCRECTSDAECRTEYPYIADLVTCGGSGRCEIEGGSTCTSMVGWCRTARAGSFVCVDGRCERCISEGECDAEYGVEWTCDLPSGQCRDTTRADAGVDAAI